MNLNIYRTVKLINKFNYGIHIEKDCTLNSIIAKSHLKFVAECSKRSQCSNIPQHFKFSVKVIIICLFFV